MQRKNYQEPRIKILRVQLFPIADSTNGDITDDPATEPALSHDNDFEEDHGRLPWNGESLWDE